ncbi:MAG: hypothetical protein K2M75_00325 [Clostridia bacterium]|nr:hypothetical protein [Clostridia bacterium]
MKVKEKFELWANKYDLTREMVNNYGARTIVFAIGSFIISVAYGAYNFTLSALNSSLWYGALASYYILLAIMRGGVLVFHNKKRKAIKKGKVIENERIKQIKKYRNCGILLVIIMFAISLAVAEMIGEDKSFEHTGIMIYASATYTFYKITVAIINIVKAKKKTADMTVQAVRNINMADALVSMLALQTSLLHAFSDENGRGQNFQYTLNGVMGLVVVVLVVALGIYMIVNAQKQLKIARTVDDTVEEDQDKDIEGE